MRVLQSSLLKLTHRPATQRTFLVLAGFLLVVYLSFAVSALDASGGSSASLDSMLSFPAALGSLAAILLIFGGVAGAAYAGTAAASEWSCGTFRAAVARGESRVRYVLGLFLAVGLVVAAAWLALYALGLVLILVAGMLRGTPIGDSLGAPSLGLVAPLLAAGGWGLLMEAALGYSMGFITRSEVAGIAAVAGLFLLERFAQLFVPGEVLQLGPTTAATTLVTVVGTTGTDAGMATPVVVITAYLVLAIGLAGAVARRCEVG